MDARGVHKVRVTAFVGYVDEVDLLSVVCDIALKTACLHSYVWFHCNSATSVWFTLRVVNSEMTCECRQQSVRLSRLLCVAVRICGDCLSKAITL